MQLYLIAIILSTDLLAFRALEYTIVPSHSPYVILRPFAHVRDEWAIINFLNMP
jgi:hypothetical protein